ACVSIRRETTRSRAATVRDRNDAAPVWPRCTPRGVRSMRTTRPGARGDHVADKAPPEEQNTDTAEAVEIPAKLRVHALAKLLGVTSKEVLATLTELGEPVKTAHSSVTKDQGERVRDAFHPPGSATQQEDATPQEDAAAPAHAAA